MCGRYRLTRRMEFLEGYYHYHEADELDLWERQYNIPPREFAPIVLEDTGKLRLTQAFWGMLPPWAKDANYAKDYSTFNAKGETVAEKNTFKHSFLRRRCIVPAEAFYEWVGPKGKKVPLSIQRKDGEPLSMAGLYNSWQGPHQEKPWVTFTIITTEPNHWMSRIHNRMPVFLTTKESRAVWLDSKIADTGRLKAYLKAPPEDWLTYYPVEARLVNSGWIDAPECVAPTDADVSPLLKE